MFVFGEITTSPAAEAFAETIIRVCSAGKYYTAF